jgi:thiamine pyrophosphate-dependent acetolactate synthase large subunit-like protein
MVENGHEKVYGRRPSYSTGQLDVCDIARGLGASVARVDGPGQLARAQQTLRNAVGPVVFDVRIDHEIQMAKRDRVAAMTPPPVVQQGAPKLRVIN